MAKILKFKVTIETKISVDVPLLDNAPEYAKKEVIAIIKRFIVANEGKKVDQDRLLKALQVHPDWVEHTREGVSGNKVEFGYPQTTVHVEPILTKNVTAQKP